MVPGCKDLDELGADLRYVDADVSERDYSEALLNMRQFESGECVYCNHCLPCPSNIDIGKTIRLLETGLASSAEAVARDYGVMDANAEECIECGDCESRCPFDVEVIPKMREAAALFRR